MSLNFDKELVTIVLVTLILIYFQAKSLRKMSCFDAGDRPARSAKKMFSTQYEKNLLSNFVESDEFTSRHYMFFSSLPRPGRNSHVFEVMRIPVEEVSSQLTLIDFELFAKIELEELISCGWIKKNKQQIAPHTVAYTRRFNHVKKIFISMRSIHLHLFFCLGELLGCGRNIESRDL